MLVALVKIAFAAWIALKYIVREQPATTNQPAKAKQTSMTVGGPIE